MLSSLKFLNVCAPLWPASIMIGSSQVCVCVCVCVCVSERAGVCCVRVIEIKRDRVKECEWAGKWVSE